MVRTWIKRVLFIGIWVIFVFVCLPDLFAAKSYRITGVSIDAQLQTDGSMDVIESRTFEFSGSFSFVFRTLTTQGRVTFQDFKVSENGRFFEL